MATEHSSYEELPQPRRKSADYREGWSEAPSLSCYRNPYRVGWEAFLRHVAANAPLVCDFTAGIRDFAFAEACHRSMQERRWVAMAEMEEELAIKG